MATRVYPDANIALHYRPFEEIDWLALVGATQVVLVVTSVFLREVDEQKDRGRGTVQKRARRFSSWLATLRRIKEWEIRGGVRVEVAVDEPEVVVDFKAHGLSLDVNDDRYIACMIRDRSAHPEAQLTCVTADAALSFKAEAKGFGVLDPPAELRLAEEPDPRDLEVRGLRQQLLDAQRRLDPQPELHLRFRVPASPPVIRLGIARLPDDEELEEALRVERGSLKMFDQIMGIRYEPLTEPVIRDYLQKVREWMPSWVERASLAMLTRPMRLVLANDGEGNAEDIDIEVTFPPYLTVGHRRDLPESDRPAEPKRRSSFASPLEYFKHDFRDILGTMSAEAIARRWSFEKSRPHRATFHVRSLKHHATEELPRFDAWVEDVAALEGVSGMKVGVRLHSSTLVQDQSIDVKLEVGERGIDFSSRGARAYAEEEPDDDED